MKLLLSASILASFVLLTACTDADWAGAMHSVGLQDTADDAAPPATEPQPVAAPAPAPDNGPNAFCQAVARQELQGQSYDPATQQRVMTRSLQQCMELHAEPR